ncbi:Uma2 family endonuclease [Paenactinomyces guangxiensis]|uniref:Uma2 family endonuclease n=1 Tax=Paenactinomyces guangxiensis TaxID=1490290 RepID=A0A7W1WPN3_9BACL|nr:Uma2 family endonuclease [Paenactinomyces guangxiensis]MBA4493767.1 Uma2 family endonuclease [Paenactinomyces guangxiensis]MBH8591056.1 Uma2 family endonuclease [Paenactinomyces guangxiensis]
MKVPTFKPNTKYSYDDYLKWNDDQRWELISGIPYNMAPAPSSRHQEILGNIFGLFFNYLKGKTCKAYLAPFEVRLSENDSDRETFNVVQPDLSIICDRKKIDERGCKGPPDLIVEVLSPGLSAKRDKIYKYDLYENYKVKEYWIVDPYNENIEVYILGVDQFDERQVYARGDQFKVSIFKDLEVNLDDVFGDEPFDLI